MKLDEVSTGSSTLKFSDYLQKLKDIQVSPKVIGELHSVGAKCLKAGATFDEQDDFVFFVFKHGHVGLMQAPESKAFFRSKVEIELNELELSNGKFPFGQASHTMNSSYKALSSADAAKIDLGAFFQKIDIAVTNMQEALAIIGDK